MMNRDPKEIKNRPYFVSSKDLIPKLVYMDSSVSVVSSGTNHSLYLTDKKSLYVSRENSQPEVLYIKPKKPLCSNCNRKRGVKYKCSVCDEYVCTSCEDFHSDELHNLQPYETPTAPNVSVIGSGYNHSFVVFENNDVFVSGNNLHGQLGVGRKDRTVQETHQYAFSWPRNVRVKGISCGRNHTIMVVNDILEESDSLRVCGSGRYGQLGTGKKYEDWKNSCEVQFVPIVDNDHDDHDDDDEGLLRKKKIRKVRCGEKFTVVLTEENVEGEKVQQLVVFGEGSDGQLGIGEKVDRQYTPTLVKCDDIYEQKITDIACGNFHTLVLTSTNIYVTGLNTSYQLGLNHCDNVFQFCKIELFSFCEKNLTYPSAVAGGCYYSVFVVREKDEEISKLHAVGKGFRKKKYVESDKKVKKVTCQKNEYIFVV